MKLPIDFKMKTINRYKKKGEKWISNINSIVEKYKYKFDLKQMRLVSDLTMNVAIYAKSDKYGDVVLKLNSPSKTSENEIKYMRSQFSNYLPRLFYSNLNDRVMLLERLYPGYSLSNLDNQEERIQIFCNILNSITINVDEKNSFRRYEDRINDDIKEVYQNPSLYKDIIEIFDKSIHMYDEIKSLNLPKFVLHCDLHHKNILKTSDSFKAIDPHGIIGERVIEMAQFIRAELEKENKNIDKLDEIIKLVGKYLNEDIIMIYRILYIDTLDKLIFYIKSGFDKNSIQYNIKVCYKILEYI